MPRCDAWIFMNHWFINVVRACDLFWGSKIKMIAYESFNYKVTWNLSKSNKQMYLWGKILQVSVARCRKPHSQVNYSTLLIIITDQNKRLVPSSRIRWALRIERRLILRIKEWYGIRAGPTVIIRFANHFLTSQGEIFSKYLKTSTKCKARHFCHRPTMLRILENFSSSRLIKSQSLQQVTEDLVDQISNRSDKLNSSDKLGSNFWCHANQDRINRLYQIQRW